MWELVIQHVSRFVLWIVFTALMIKKGVEEAKVDGFVPKETDSLYIDPDECIDCGACEPECPVEAIFEESEVPAEWEKYIKLNYDFFGREMV